MHTDTAAPARFDSIRPGDQVHALGAGWCTVTAAYSRTAIVGRASTGLHLVGPDGGTYELRDADAGTIPCRRAA